MPLNFVAVVGGANMDIVARTPVDGLWGDSTPGQIQCSPGGVARNMAENLARLGHETHLISAVGEDEFGRSLHAATQAAGVDVSGFQVLPSYRTATYLSVHGADGDMKIAVNDMAILEALTPEFLQPHAARLTMASVLVLDCNLSSPTLAWLFNAAARPPVFVDGVSVPKCLRLSGLLAHVHTLKVNQLEAQALSGLPTHSIEEAQAAALALHLLGVRNVVVSLGAQGLCWCDDAGVVGACAAASVDVVNSAGAGDALMAGLVHAHVSGWSLAQAVPFAMACAEMTLTTTLANHPALSVGAVLAQMAAHPHSTPSFS